MADTLVDNGLIINSYIVGIPVSETPGAQVFQYTFDSHSHALPVSEETVKDVTGLFNGGGAVRQQEKVTGKIWAVTGTPAPAQLVRFPAAFNGYSSRFWKATDLTIDSSTGPLRSYSVTLTQAKNLAT